MPISIDMHSSLQKVCANCYNKLEILHSLVVSYIRIDMHLKQILNIEREVSIERD